MAKKVVSKSKQLKELFAGNTVSRLVFCKGDSIIGRVLRVSTVKKGLKKGVPSHSYQFEFTEGPRKGEQVYFFGCKILDDILPGAIGQNIKICYNGKKSLSSGKSLHEYRVFLIN